MTETIIVTGGAGFIGSHIAERLLKDGQRVRIVDNLCTGSLKNIEHLKGDLEFHRVSVTNKSALDEIFKGADYVYHQAALASVPRSIDDPLETHEYNATGTLNVLVAARKAGVKRVVYAASSSAYGDVETEFTHESMPPRPISPYGVAKLMGEYYCQVFTQVYGLETVCLRYFNVFGPRQDPTSQYAAVIPIFITAMLANKQPTIFGDGSQTRDFTYIDNVVHGNLLAANAPQAAGQVMNLATGGRVTLLELVAKLNVIMGKTIDPILDQPRSGDILHSRASIDKAQDLLDYTSIVDFDTGLARTVEWYENQQL
jgi:UDP-glucose 4-epimerase